MFTLFVFLSIVALACGALMTVTLRGPLVEVEVAPWTAAFDPDEATWTTWTYDDLVGQGIQFPTPENATVANPDGTNQRSAVANRMTIPVANLGAAFVASLTDGGRYVVKLTFDKGGSTQDMLFGKTNGAVARVGDPGGAEYGGVGVQLVEFETTGGPGTKTYEPYTPGS